MTILAACAAASLALGCARAPAARTGAQARARLIAGYARGDGAARGAGSISLSRAGHRRGGARAHWAAEGESLVVAGYMGPVRMLDAALMGDSLYLALRHDDLAVAGRLVRPGMIQAELLRFIATPWSMGTPWVREALERGQVESSGTGWVCRGTARPGSIGGDPDSAAEYRFSLWITPNGSPLRCSLSRVDDDRDLVSIGYGPERRREGGLYPRWIEWSFSGTVVRLSLDDVSPHAPRAVRLPPAADPSWTLLGLDEPRGVALIRWLLGLPEVGVEP